MKKLTLQSIKERYPHPVVPNNNGKKDDYCIGGAFCLSFEEKKENHFPPRRVIAQYLKAYAGNRRVTSAHYQLACDIVYHNDRQEFEESWGLLGQFLRVVNKKEEIDRD